MPRPSMRMDFRRAVLTLLAGSGFAGIVPFIWYRFMVGLLLLGLVAVGFRA